MFCHAKDVEYGFQPDDRVAFDICTLSRGDIWFIQVHGQALLIAYYVPKWSPCANQNIDNVQRCLTFNMT